MIITPYESIDMLMFGRSTFSDCIALYGTPSKIGTNRFGTPSYYYKDKIIRFDPKTEVFNDCTIHPKLKGRIAGIAITWDRRLLKNLLKIETNPRHSSGFVIFPMFGTILGGIHDFFTQDLSICFFSKHQLPELMDGSEPFDINEWPTRRR